MADGFIQVAPDSTGKKVDNSELTVGANTVERQRIVNADDTVAAALARVLNAQPASTDYGLAVRQAGDGLAPTIATASSNGQTLFSLDALGYARVDFQLVGTFAFSIAIQTSDDNTNWVGAPIYTVTAGPPISTSGSASAVGQYYSNIRGRYVRCVTTAFTSNTSGVLTAFLRDKPPSIELTNVLVQNTPAVTGNRGISNFALAVTPMGASAATDFSSARIASAATTNATSVKGSAGNFYGGFLSNTSASAKFFKFYNKATAPTVGTDTPVWTLLLPAGASINLSMDMNPLRFATGIAYAITGLVADTDTTAVAVNDVIGFLNYA